MRHASRMHCRQRLRLVDALGQRNYRKADLELRGPNNNTHASYNSAIELGLAS